MKEALMTVAKIPLLLLTAITLSSSAIAAKKAPVIVKEGTGTFQGDLFLPNQTGKPLPLVVVVHEWWGKNTYPEMRASRIAEELGYAALAVDLYGNSRIAGDPKEAQALSAPFYKDPEMGVKRLKEFIAAAPSAAVAASGAIDTSKIAVIGYCFGGGQALNLARADQMPENENLLGVVSFHGSLASTLQAHKPIKTKILVLHGGSDQMVKPQDVANFKAEMKKAGADLSFISYPKATHAFTNPEATELGKKYHIPISYNAEADKKSWDEMVTFLRKIFE
jgi:dienelactone hydrolase